jgi:DNA-binding IclR family transcriptional regulator
MHTIVDLLHHMDQLRPRPLETTATCQRFEWNLGNLRKCLVTLEQAGIVRYLGGDRWQLDVTHMGRGVAVDAAQRAGIDIHFRYD